MYKASGEELVQIERRNYLTLGEAIACLPACLLAVWRGGWEGRHELAWPGTGRHPWQRPCRMLCDLK